MYHGSLLSSYTGELRSDLTLLATFEDGDSMRGYNIWREWYFFEAEPHEPRSVEANLIEYLRELASESVQFHDDEQTWHHAIGCLLRELSGQLFPATPRSFGIGKHNASIALRTTADTRFKLSKGSSVSNCAPFPIVGIWLRTRCCDLRLGVKRLLTSTHEDTV
jgi:hypothetical protein